MNNRKYGNLIKNYSGFFGQETFKSLFDQIPENLKKRLTGKELGIIMSLMWHSKQVGFMDNN
jgi:hypothetical protein